MTDKPAFLKEEQQFFSVTRDNAEAVVEPLELGKRVRDDYCS